ncbi:MAG: UMP kinase [Candidatus Saccharimonadales bacterium]|nr:UMP kinase [Candidatus Saccharimonadales bacterium]
MSKYKRVLLKLSGEQFSGGKGMGIDPEFMGWVAEEIKKAADTGVQIVVVAGAGNFIRGADFAGRGIDRATADYMGMISGVLNGQALMDIMKHTGQDTRVMTNIKMDEVAEPFIRRKAIRHLEKGRVVIVAGGSGKPFFTHDTAGVNIALELSCDIFLKSTKVDGVYDKDPEHNHDAVKLDHVTYQQALENPNIYVMDKAALGLAMEQKMPVRIFKLEENAIRRVAEGEDLGTLISS